MTFRYSERGQATAEWVGLIALVALIATAALTFSRGSIPGTGLARAIAAKIVCAADLGGVCQKLAGRGTGDPVLDTYGPEVGGLLRDHSPLVLFESGEFSLPVDFRLCRERMCSDAGTGRVRVESSRHHQLPTAFTRVVDCRSGQAHAQTDGCGGSAAGNLYLQYWLYYPDSYTEPWGEAGYHPDDWESYQVRIDPDGQVLARASSHNSYNHGAGIRGTMSDLGDRYGIDLRDSAWGRTDGRLWVSEGSHAGRVRGGVAGHLVRSKHLRLVPLEPRVGELEPYEFDVAPPWEKAVWSDPESRDT